MSNLDTIKFNLWIKDTLEVSGYNNRLNMLVGAKIIPPTQLIFSNETLRKIYSESIMDYLYGSPNSSIPIIIKFFQITIRDKFRQVKGDPQANPKVEDIINWVEKFLDQKTTAHGFQILRNLVHTEELVVDQDALEGIRHVSIIVNKVLPYEFTFIDAFCSKCSTTHHYKFKKEDYYIGNDLTLQCPNNRFPSSKTYFKANI